MQAYLYAILDVLAKVGWGGFILYNNDMLFTSYSKGCGPSLMAVESVYQTSSAELSWHTLSP